MYDIKCIRRQHNKFNIEIYRKPTATDTTINFFSNHPIEQKMAAFRSHLNRMHFLTLSQEKKTERMGNHTSKKKQQFPKTFNSKT